MQLSQHFTLEELTFSSTAQRLGIDNTPPAEIVANLTTLAAHLEMVRSLLGNQPMHIDSAYRCEALERVLCMKDFQNWCVRHGRQAMDPTSWDVYFATKAHPKGFAADVLCPGYGNPVSIVHAIVNSSIPFDQIIQEGTWAHYSCDPANRRQVLTADFSSGNGPQYTQGA